MVNKVILVGNVGADPEVRTLENGTKVARIRVATTERFFNRDSQERREHTEWHNVTLWRGLADVVDKYIRKGSQVYIEGRIRSREWEDQATGTKRYGYEIVADVMNMLGRRGDNPSEGYGGGMPQSQVRQPSASYAAPQNTPAPQAAPSVEPIDDADDLPF
ncbi:single-stranded DNA-binding protein [Alistipes sp. OttesenSCG-928-L06]|nr:single-stranded DNA-binding protein [Alistipes sp. OttesenSCG-928-L06]